MLDLQIFIRRHFSLQRLAWLRGGKDQEVSCHWLLVPQVTRSSGGGTLLEGELSLTSNQVPQLTRSSGWGTWIGGERLLRTFYRHLIFGCFVHSHLLLPWGGRWSIPGHNDHWPDKRMATDLKKVKHWLSPKANPALTMTTDQTRRFKNWNIDYHERRILLRRGAHQVGGRGGRAWRELQAVGWQGEH